MNVVYSSSKAKRDVTDERTRSFWSWRRLTSLMRPDSERISLSLSHGQLRGLSSVHRHMVR